MIYVRIQLGAKVTRHRIMLQRILRSIEEDHTAVQHVRKSESSRNDVLVCVTWLLEMMMTADTELIKLVPAKHYFLMYFLTLISPSRSPPPLKKKQQKKTVVQISIACLL